MASIDALVCEAQRGSRRAQSELYRRLHRRTFAWAMKILGHVQDAEDAVQRAWVKIFTRLETFNAESKFTTWAHRIVHNQSLDLLRMRSRIIEKGRVSEDFAWQIGEAIHCSLEHQSGLRDEAGLWMQAFERLSPNHQQVLRLLANGYAYKSIADEAGIAVGTCMTRIFHARRNLAKHFAAFSGYIPDSIPVRYQPKKLPRRRHAPRRPAQQRIDLEPLVVQLAGRIAAVIDDVFQN